MQLATSHTRISRLPNLESPAPMLPSSLADRMLARMIASLDSTSLLHSLDKLDVDGNGRLDVADALRLERLGRSAARAAQLAPERPAITMASANAFAGVRLTDRGAVDGTGRSRGQLRELASHIGFAAQQARYGAALVAPGSALNTTVHNAYGVQGLPQTVTPPDVIRAIDSVDVARLRDAGVKPVATFDVDGTSIKGDIYVPFLELMAAKGKFGAPANPAFRAALSRLDVDQDAVRRNDANENARLLLSRFDPTIKSDTPSRISIPSLFFTTGDALKGQRLSDMRAVARELMEQGVGATPPYRLNLNDDSARAGDGVADVVAALHAKGIEPFIVTNGFGWLAEVAAPYMGIDPRNVIGTNAEVKDGVLTGQHDGRTIVSKDQRVRIVAGSPPLFAFGDSGSDLPMLDQAVARGFVINPELHGMHERIAERDGAVGQLRYSGTVGSVAEAIRGNRELLPSFAIGRGGSLLRDG